MTALYAAAFALAVIWDTTEAWRRRRRAALQRRIDAL